MRIFRGVAGALHGPVHACAHPQTHAQAQALSHARALAAFALAALALGLAGLTLSGCTFQPRAALDLPGPVQVKGGPQKLRSALEARLAGSGAQLAKRDADVVINLRSEGFSERLLTVEPLRGHAREYQVAYHVRYTVRDRKRENVLDPGEVSLLREYRLHRGERLSRSRERRVVRDEMLREAAAAIVRQLHVSAGR